MRSGRAASSDRFRGPRLDEGLQSSIGGREFVP